MLPEAFVVPVNVRPAFGPLSTLNTTAPPETGPPVVLTFPTRLAEPPTLRVWPPGVSVTFDVTTTPPPETMMYGDPHASAPVWRSSAQ